MSSSAAVLTKSELFDLYIRKFRSICDMHGLHRGSQDDLREFMRKLADDSHFAMDFWAFAGKLSSREGGQLSDEEMLTVIVEGVAGSGSPGADPELKNLIGELAVLLSGVDVQSPLPNDGQPALLPVPDSQSSAREQTEHAGGETPLRTYASQSAFISEAANREAGVLSPSHSKSSSSSRVVFISDSADREAGPTPSLSSRQSSPPRAVFTSESVDREAVPAPSLPSRRSPSSRAVFTSETSEPVDREAIPAPPLPSRRTSSPRAVFISEPGDPEANPVISLPSSPRAVSVSETAGLEPGDSSSLPAQLVEALRWLQLSSLELKQHLNEIDQKMSRLDPSLEEPPTKVSSLKAKIRAFIEEPASVEQSPRAPAAKSIPIVQDDRWPGPELLAGAFGEQWNAHSTPTPLEQYAQPLRLHGKTLFVVLLLVVAGSTFLLQEYGDSLHASFGPGIQRVESALASAIGQSPATGAVARPETEQASEEISLTPPEPETTTPSANRRVARDTSTPSGVMSGLGRTLGQAAQTALSGAQSLSVTSNFSSRPSRGAMPSRSASAPTDNSAQSQNSAPSDGGAGVVDVPPAMMQPNLLLSPVPAYPRAARVEHVSGAVVVKAIISRSGAVEDVRVMEGDPLLRGAASEAIYKWRFKPYVLNGQPVKVATTITVDFKPHR
jgi:TonB family protein